MQLFSKLILRKPSENKNHDKPYDLKSPVTLHSSGYG